MTKTVRNRTIVAVYGSLKRGFFNHYLLETSHFMAQGTVNGFDMFSLGSYPMVVPGSGQITVELFEVDSDTFARLDRLEGYPRYYDRQLVTVETLHCPVEAWMYLGRPEQVKGCCPVPSGAWNENEDAAMLR